MLYSVVLVSAVQQSESAICIHISQRHDFLKFKVRAKFKTVNIKKKS